MTKLRVTSKALNDGDVAVFMAKRRSRGGGTLTSAVLEEVLEKINSKIRKFVIEVDGDLGPATGQSVGMKCQNVVNSWLNRNGKIQYKIFYCGDSKFVGMPTEEAASYSGLSKSRGPRAAK
jgi:hypothetical protein